MAWLENWQRGRAIKLYARRLPRLLVKDYGGAEAYTPAQIRASIQRHGLNRHFESCAVAMFSDRENFERFRAEFGEARDYEEMRSLCWGTFSGGSDLNAINFLAQSGFAEGGAPGHESGDFGGHHGP